MIINYYRCKTKEVSVSKIFAFSIDGLRHDRAMRGCAEAAGRVWIHGDR